jgi:hypothetical protein
MPRQVVGRDPPRSKQPGQPHLEREQARLREHRLVHQPGGGAAGTGAHHLRDRAAQQRIQVPAHLAYRVREHGERPGQRPSHPGPLRPLPGEHERDLARPAFWHLARDHPRGRGTRGYRLQPGCEPRRISGEHHRPFGEYRPSRRQRPPHVGHVRAPAPPARERGQAGRLTAQPGIAASRHHPRQYCPGGATPRDPPALLSTLGGPSPQTLLGGTTRPPVTLLGRLLHDHVRVRPADAERRHAHAARMPVPRPVAFAGQQPDGACRPVHVRGELAGMQGAGQHLVPQRHYHLDHAGHPGRRLRVPDVGLHRAQPQRPLRVPALAIGGGQRLRLDRIA